MEGRCWSPSRNCYVAYADADGLDAVVLLGSRMGYHQPDHPRLRSTVAPHASRSSRRAPLLYRTSELRGHEGAFVACSFWLVEALARQGDVEEAAALMEDLLGHANDVGLYSEEIDPQTGEFLGNIPQALSHMALIDATVRADRAPPGRPGDDGGRCRHANLGRDRQARSWSARRRPAPTRRDASASQPPLGRS